MYYDLTKNSAAPTSRRRWRLPGEAKRACSRPLFIAEFTKRSGQDPIDVYSEASFGTW
jgi:hypothetical protein